MSSSSEPSPATVTTLTEASKTETTLSSFSTPLPSPPPPPTPLATTTVPENYHETEETYPPLTTHWTAPLSCTWTYNVDNQPQPGATGAVAWLDLEPVNNASTLSCYPDGMFTDGRTGTFSPATCPNGWTTVTVFVNTNEVKDKATTTAICCSSEYYLDGTHCKRSVPTVLAVPITYNTTASTYEVMTQSTTTLYSATIAVYTIKALFQEQDKQMLGISGDDDIDDEDHTNPLDLGARIGIGIGVTVFVLLLLAGIGLFFHRRDRSRSKRSNEVHAMRDRGRHWCADDEEMSQHRPSHDVEPPPAYEPASERNRVDDDDDDESEDSSSARDDEIRVLRVQKEAIQRRIEELQRADTEGNDERSSER